MNIAADPFDLARFLAGQERDYPRALAELRAGRKTGHWIWYILPQLRGLGLSSMSAYYGLASLDEARAYLAHPVLGERLRECVRAVNAHTGTAPELILGDVDALKLRSCLTLFRTAAPDERCFAQALAAFYGGADDPRTLALLAAQARGRDGREP